MNSLRRYVLKYWKSISLALLFLTCEAICDLFQPTIMARIVDQGIAHRDMQVVLSLMGRMFIITGIGAVAAVGRNILSSRASTGFGADVRSGLFRAIQSFSFASIDRFETGSLVTRLTSDVNQVQLFFKRHDAHFRQVAHHGRGKHRHGGFAQRENVFSARGRDTAYRAGHGRQPQVRFSLCFSKVQKAVDAVNTVTQEYLAGVRVVKAFNRFDYERHRFGAANEGLAAATTRAMRVMAFFGPGIGLSLNIGIIAVLWFGGLRVNSGGMRVGEVIAFTNYMTQILFSLMMISMVVAMFARARASADRIAEVLDNKDTMRFAGRAKPSAGATSGVDFNHVFFGYGGQTAPSVLSDIHCSVARGETIGLIGSTGAGKTSLMYLLPRFYDVTSGAVTVGGVDVREMEAAALRETIAMVPQKTTLFTGTILENLRWGSPAATREAIERAAIIAQAHDFVTAFPEGYDTMLGQGGVNLSGGQKQRLSIARALVRQPAILILDDCTSSVDGRTEANIREGLSAHLGGLTTFIITQRITSVLRADRIMVLENGRMAGLGTHGELMSNCEVYRDIYRSQIGPDGNGNG
jgi:ATP-binding cassette subfamily B multidrug efflux pump